MPSIRKRSFLLFELLISLALIVLCLFPMIKPHAQMRKAQIKQLEEMQMQRIVQEAFCVLKQKLYENKEHTFSELMVDAKGTLDKTFTLSIGADKTKELNCLYVLKHREHFDKRSQNKTGLTLDVELTFTPESHPNQVYKRTLYLEGYKIK